jgi:hypothetical protein
MTGVDEFECLIVRRRGPVHVTAILLTSLETASLEEIDDVDSTPG